MDVETNPLQESFQPGQEYAALDAPSFMEQLAEVPDEVPVYWRSNKDDAAYPGIWMRRGAYKLKHGSFVDPVDLSCFAAQHYVADSAGRHECVQIGHGTSCPEDGTPVEDVGELRRAVDQLASPDIKLLQPDGAFELHGALTKGWSARAYALVAEGATETVLVFD